MVDLVASVCQIVRFKPIRMPIECHVQRNSDPWLGIPFRLRIRILEHIKKCGTIHFLINSIES